ATATPRAPDGTKARTAVTDQDSTAHCRLFQSGNSFASHRAAACTEAPRRRADCGYDPATSRSPLPLPRASMPGCLGIARCTLVPAFLCERRNENAPGMESEGIRRASEDRGDRSPAGGVDQGWGVAPSYANRAHRPASRFGSDGIRCLAMWFGMDMIEVRLSWKKRVARIREGAHITRIGKCVQAVNRPKLRRHSAGALRVAPLDPYR